MKTTIFRNHQRGGVLAMTLVIALLVGIVAGALLVVSQQHNYLTARSQTWCSEIPVAEAGIEEAMAHINTRPSHFATNGWTNSANGNTVLKYGTVADGYYYTTITTSIPPAIVSIGYGRIPLQKTFTHRTVLALTSLAPPAWGIVAKQNISMDGSTVYVDSYDSSDSRFSDTNGNYDPFERRDRAGVATISRSALAIDTKGGKVYGSVATGPGGTAVGNVGDGSYLADGGSGIQDGHFSDDFNMAIPDVEVPAALRASPPPLSRLVGLKLYTYYLGSGDYALPLGLTLGGPMLVTGHARLYINGPIRITGSGSGITIEKGASLEIYCNGTIDIGGNGIVNGSNIPAACVLRGTPACTSVKYSGNAELHAVVYVPQATLEMVGTTEFSGSIVADIISFKGTPAIHYDESLSGSGPDYRIVSWQEIGP